MADGTEVRIRARVTWYDRGGRLQLQMSDIDPAFTLGRLAADRDRLLRTLEGEGLLTRQALLPRPVLPLRLGLVTSRGSAAEHDVLDELRRSGIGFSVITADVRVQGAHAPRSVAWGLRAVAARGVDAVLLVRGGGATTDLAAFDGETIARAVATLDVPVLTGIGHEIDRSVADEVAHATYKTPTACAQAVVADVRAVEADTDDTWRRIVAAARRGGRAEAERLRTCGHHVALATRQGLAAADRDLAARRRPRGAGGGRGPRPVDRRARPCRRAGRRRRSGPPAHARARSGGRGRPAGAAAAPAAGGGRARARAPSTPRCEPSIPGGCSRVAGRSPAPPTAAPCGPPPMPPPATSWSRRWPTARCAVPSRPTRPPQTPRPGAHDDHHPVALHPLARRSVARLRSGRSRRWQRHQLRRGPGRARRHPPRARRRRGRRRRARRPGPAGGRAAPAVPVPHRRRPLRSRAGGGRARGRSRSGGRHRRGRRRRRRRSPTIDDDLADDGDDDLGGDEPDDLGDD